MGKAEGAYLVSRGHPSSLGDHLLSADVNVGAGSGDVVLEIGSALVNSIYAGSGGDSWWWRRRNRRIW
jgi:hypothetical protein